MTEKALAHFAARYLNAVRLGETKLTEWLVSSSKEPVPNFCDTCKHREGCHKTFKASDDDFGLYPFTSRALMNMAVRADEQFDSGFNPRAFQRSVLLRVLDNHAHALKGGVFPPRALLDELGGIKALGIEELDRLRGFVGAQRFDRAVTFQELWYGTATLRKPPTEMAEALSLPRFEAAEEQPDGAEPTVDDQPVAATPNSERKFPE